MSVNTKRVFYMKYLSHGIFADLLGARPDVRLDKLENDTAEQTTGPILAAAHAFQIGAARDEVASTYHVDKQLLRRTPNLLIVSSNGAGYDTDALDGKRPARIVNTEAWPHYARRFERAFGFSPGNPARQSAAE
jgi:D-3-phosphoglycerate dehydrogenase